MSTLTGFFRSHGRKLSGRDRDLRRPPSSPDSFVSPELVPDGASITVVISNDASRNDSASVLPDPGVGRGLGSVLPDPAFGPQLPDRRRDGPGWQSSDRYAHRQRSMSGNDGGYVSPLHLFTPHRPVPSPSTPPSPPPPPPAPSQSMSSSPPTSYKPGRAAREMSTRAGQLLRIASATGHRKRSASVDEDARAAVDNARRRGETNPGWVARPLVANRTRASTVGDVIPVSPPAGSVSPVVEKRTAEAGYTRAPLTAQLRDRALPSLPLKDERKDKGYSDGNGDPPPGLRTPNVRSPSPGLMAAFGLVTGGSDDERKWSQLLPTARFSPSRASSFLHAPSSLADEDSGPDDARRRPNADVDVDIDAHNPFAPISVAMSRSPRSAPGSLDHTEPSKLALQLWSCPYPPPIPDKVEEIHTAGLRRLGAHGDDDFHIDSARTSSESSEATLASAEPHPSSALARARRPAPIQVPLHFGGNPKGPIQLVSEGDGDGDAVSPFPVSVKQKVAAWNSGTKVSRGQHMRQDHFISLSLFPSPSPLASVDGGGGGHRSPVLRSYSSFPPRSASETHGDLFSRLPLDVSQDGEEDPSMPSPLPSRAGRARKDGVGVGVGVSAKPSHQSKRSNTSVPSSLVTAAAASPPRTKVSPSAAATRQPDVLPSPPIYPPRPDVRASVYLAANRGASSPNPGRGGGGPLTRTRSDSESALAVGPSQPLRRRGLSRHSSESDVRTGAGAGAPSAAAAPVAVNPVHAQGNAGKTPTSRTRTRLVPKEQEPKLPTISSKAEDEPSMRESRSRSSSSSAKSQKQPNTIDSQPTFERTPVLFRGHSLTEARAQLSSSELKNIVSTAIRDCGAGAGTGTIKLLRTDDVESLGAHLRGLREQRNKTLDEMRTEIGKRNQMLVAILNAFHEAEPESANRVSSSSLVSALTAADELGSRLYTLHDQIWQLKALRNSHAQASLFLALTKLNASLLKSAEKIKKAESERDAARKANERLAKSLIEAELRVAELEGGNRRAGAPSSSNANAVGSAIEQARAKVKEAQVKRQSLQLVADLEAAVAEEARLAAMPPLPSSTDKATPVDASDLASELQGFVAPVGTTTVGEIDGLLLQLATGLSSQDIAETWQRQQHQQTDGPYRSRSESSPPNLQMPHGDRLLASVPGLGPPAAIISLQDDGHPRTSGASDTTAVNTPPALPSTSAAATSPNPGLAARTLNSPTSAFRHLSQYRVSQGNELASIALGALRAKRAELTAELDVLRGENEQKGSSVTPGSSSP